MPTDDTLLKSLADAVESNLQNEQFGVEELAEAVGMSRSNLHRKLQSLTGQSVSQFIREYRLERALELLQNENLTASEVSHQVGFGSATYFSKSFHEYFGFTPGEAKGRTPTSPKRSTKNPMRKRILPIAATLFILAIMATWYFGFTDSTTDKSVEEKSIVVLPFENISNNPDQQFFADGVMDGILSQLIKIPEILAISRTTSMRYVGTEMSLPEIASELNVNYVLEGGVQQDENNIRVSVKLIDAKRDVQLWSQIYDRELSGIFEIQSEIAQNVARELTITLSGETQEKIPTQNTEAYMLYLRGLNITSGLRSSQKAAQLAINLFEKAIELDSTMIEPYIHLAEAYGLHGGWVGHKNSKDAFNSAKPYCEKAARINPNHPDLLNVNGLLEYLFNWNFSLADSSFSISKERTGKRYFVVSHLDLMLLRYGKLILETDQELKIDPFSSGLYWPLAYAYFHTGSYEKARLVFEKGIELLPTSEALIDHYGNILNALGDYSKAIEVLEKGLISSSQRHASMVGRLAISYHHLGKSEKETALVAELLERDGSGENEIKWILAHYYAGTNQPEKAFEWLYKSYHAHEVDMIWLQADPMFQKLQDDPRYLDLVQKVGFPEGYIDQIKIDMR